MRVWELRAPGLDHLVLAERPMPEPGPRQVVVRVRASALNSRDLQIVHGRYDPTQRYPIVPLSDGCGEIVSCGGEVSRFKAGDRVIASFFQSWTAGRRRPENWASTLGGHYDGTLSDYALFEETGLVPAPAHLDDVQAASLGVAGVTAWHALIERGEIKPGDTVLLQGTGGVSLFGLLFARLAGARAIVTSSSDEKIERAKAMGAFAGVNYRKTPDWAQAVLELTGGEGVDHVIENAGDLRGSVNALAIGGTVSLIGYMSQLDLAGQSNEPMRYGVEIFSVLLKTARIQGIAAAPRESYETMVRAIEAAKLLPPIDEVFAFPDAKSALARLEAGAAFGKVCILHD